MENQNEMHTVLGANGAMGMAIVDELKKRNLSHKLISKNGSAGNPSIEKADMLDKDEALKAIEGSQYVYLCVGLPYDSKIWIEQWPVVMQNVVEACSVHKSKLIFFDNVYMYSNPLPIPFDENTEQSPTTRKGKVRKRIADLFLKAIEDHKIDGLIARSADFYGNNSYNSILYITILDKMLKGKNPLSLSNGNILHTYSHIEDNARAMIMLSLNKDCYGKVWHLPVSKPITLNQIIELFNQELNSKFKLKVLPKFMLNILSWWVPTIKEAKEMQYQFANEYLMSDRSFTSRFPGFEKTPIEKGLKKMAIYFKNTCGNK